MPVVDSQNRHILRSVPVKVRNHGLVGESIWERSPGTDKAAIQLAQEDISGTAFPRQGDNIRDAIAVEVSDARTNAAARKMEAIAERTIAITGFDPKRGARESFLVGKIGQTITVEVRARVSTLSDVFEGAGLKVSGCLSPDRTVIPMDVGYSKKVCVPIAIEVSCSDSLNFAGTR